MSAFAGLLRPGQLHSVAAVLVAVTTTVVIASAAPLDREIGGRLAVAGVVIFAVALVAGSRRLVGISSFPVLGAALAVSPSSDPAWVRSIVVGCLWYVAVELAWDSIERRDGAERSSALERRRVNEVATVVTLALLVTMVGYFGSEIAPQRTLLTQGPVIVALLTMLTITARRVDSTRP